MRRLIMSGETFARLIVTDPLDGQAEKLELSADWRAHDPVQLDVGPVLHPDDAVATRSAHCSAVRCRVTFSTLTRCL